MPFYIFADKKKRFMVPLRPLVRPSVYYMSPQPVNFFKPLTDGSL